MGNFALSAGVCVRGWVTGIHADRSSECVCVFAVCVCVFWWTEDMTVECVQRVSRCWEVSREICEHSNATMLQRCIRSVCFLGIRPI